MNLVKTKKNAAFVAVVAIPLAIIWFFGVYVTISDGIFAGLVLQGVFFPPIEKFYLVTNGINRFVLPVAYLYNLWPEVSWLDLLQLVPAIVTLLLTLYLIYAAILKTITGKRIIPISIAITALFGIIFSESTILYDPLSSSLMLPLLVFLVPIYCQHRWAKVGAYLLLAFLLILCWQLRHLGIFIGLVPAMGLLFLIDMAPLRFLRQYKFPLLLIGLTFALLKIGHNLQDRTILPEEESIGLLDSYIYTFSDGMFAKPGTYDLKDPVDSIKLTSYYSFYFPEPTDTSIKYIKNITYPTLFNFDMWRSLPNKWGLFWERATVDEPMVYYGYGRLLWFMAAGNGFFLLWAFLLAPTQAWRWKALLWSIFAWGYIISIGVAVKMIYKLAAPLSFFFLFSFLWLALQIFRERAATSSRFLAPLAGLAFAVLAGIAIVQLKTYVVIKHERQAGLHLKQKIITEINTLFPDKLLVLDFFSIAILEEKIGADNTSRILKPKATMFGDYYMSLFPTNKKHLESLTGTSDFVSFFQYCANHEVVLVMSQHRIDLIKSYLKLVKGVELNFVPLEGDYQIEQLDHSFYEVPLLLNYYQVTFSEPK
jgi:hypothetical protein